MRATSKFVWGAIVMIALSSPAAAQDTVTTLKARIAALEQQNQLGNRRLMTRDDMVIVPGPHATPAKACQTLHCS